MCKKAQKFILISPKLCGLPLNLLRHEFLNKTEEKDTVNSFIVEDWTRLGFDHIQVVHLVMPEVTQYKGTPCF